MSRIETEIRAELEKKITTAVCRNCQGPYAVPTHDITTHRCCLCGGPVMIFEMNHAVTEDTISKYATP